MIIVLLLVGCSTDPTAAKASVAVPQGTGQQEKGEVVAVPGSVTQPPYVFSMKGYGEPCLDSRANAHAMVTWVNASMAGIEFIFTLKGEGLNGTLEEQWEPIWWERRMNEVNSHNPTAQHCWHEVLTYESDEPVPTDDRVNTEDADKLLTVFPKLPRYQFEVQLPIEAKYQIEDEDRMLDTWDPPTVHLLDPPYAKMDARLAIDLSLAPGKYTYTIEPWPDIGAHRALKGECEVFRDGKFKCPKPEGIKR